MSSPADNVVAYEQPLNERMRSFLRLEHLFERARHELHSRDAWSSRATLETMINIMALVGRADLRTELIKELERHASTLEALSRNPKVDPERLQEIHAATRETLQALRNSENAPGHELRQNELLSAVRQRQSIPAGTCDFDLPAFHFWLCSSDERRFEDLSRWLSVFDGVRDAISLCLTLVRQSATATRELAAGGFFQRNLDSSTPCQMVRVVLPRDAPWYPEISAGRHRFTVRFMRNDNVETRPAQTDVDVEFDLLCCVI